MNVGAEREADPEAAAEVEAGPEVEAAMEPDVDGDGCEVVGIASILVSAIAAVHWIAPSNGLRSWMDYALGSDRITESRQASTLAQTQTVSSGTTCLMNNSRPERSYATSGK